MSRTSNNHLCGLGVFWSGRWSGLSFTVCEWLIRGRNLEGSARCSALVDGIATLAWAALLGGGGRPFRTRNGESSTEGKPRFCSGILWSDCSLHTRVKKSVQSGMCKRSYVIQLYERRDSALCNIHRSFLSSAWIDIHIRTRLAKREGSSPLEQAHMQTFNASSMFTGMLLIT
jgi:hypothetical protein